MINKKLLTFFLLITFVLLATTVVSAADSSDGETAVQSDMQANTVSTSDHTSTSSDSNSQATTSSNTQTTTNTHSNSETVSSTSDTNNAKTTSDTSSSNTNTQKTSDANTHSTSYSDDTKTSDTQTTSTQTTTKDTTSSQSSVSDVKTSSSDTKEANNTLTTVSSNLVDEKTQLKTDYSIDPDDETKYTANSYDDLVSAVTDIKELTSDKTYTIYLGDGTHDETYEVTGSITWGSSTGTVRNLIIDGQNHVTIDGLEKYRFMSVSSGYNLTLQNITIVNCKAGSGGAISNGGNLTITGTTTFKNNEANGGQYSGGGAISNTGNVTIDGSVTFDSNTAIAEGGAIFSYNSSTSSIKPSVSINNAIFINNEAPMDTSDEEHVGRGGAISSFRTNLTITNSYFINNEASRGGAICSINNDTYIKDSYFYGNTAHFDDIENAAYGGGAIDVEESNITITGSTFTKNSAPNTYGGAVNIYHAPINEVYGTIYVGRINITNNTFSENEALIGGGLFIFEGNKPLIFIGTITYGPKTIENLIFNNNTAEIGGGMVFVSGSSDNIVVSNLTFYGNTAESAGGLAASSNSSDTYIKNSTFINNTALDHGGAYYEGGDITVLQQYASGNVHYIQDCTFTGNEVTEGYGGAIFGTTVFTIENSKFTDNVAPMTPEGGGGAIAFMNEIQASSTSNVRSYINSISNSEFTHNTGYQGSSILIMGYSGSHNDRYNRSDKIENCVFSNDIGVNGIIETYNSINITKCTFSNDDETKQDSEYGTTYGAAIVLNGTNYEEESGVVIEAKVYVTDCLFENLTADEGGAIFAGLEEGTHIDGLINITNSTFYNCSAYNGGALYLDNIEANITNSLFFENYAITNEKSDSGIGGAIYITGTDDKITIKNSSFIKNNATKDGGAIYHDIGSLNITNSTFSLNTAGTESSTGNGGAIYATDHESAFNITNTNFTSNSATGNGGAIDTVGNLNITKSNFTTNEAINGGAIYNQAGTDKIDNTYFTENKATEFGGAIYNIGTLTLESNEFIDNSGQFNETIYNSIDYMTMTNNYIKMTNYTLNAFVDQKMYSPIIDTTVSILQSADPSETIIYDIYHPELGTIENSEVITREDSGESYVTYAFQDAGVYTIKIIYEDSSNSIEFNAFVFDTATITLDEDSLKAYPGQTITIEGSLKSKTGNTYFDYTEKTVDVYANGQLIKDDLSINENGIFTFTYTAIEGYNSFNIVYDGIEYLTVTYLPETVGFDGFYAYYIETTITVEPNPDSINPTDEITFFGTVKYVDENGDEQPVSSGTVTLYIDGNQIGEPQTITEGTYEVTFTTTLNDATGNTIKVQLGYNIIEAVYTPAEGTYYATATDNSLFNVERISTTIQIDQIAYQEIGNEIEINGTLLDENGEPLVDKILTVIIDHDVDYNPTETTNSTGGFTIKFIDETSEIDLVTIRFAGDEKYEYSINTALADFEKIHTEIHQKEVPETTISETIHVDGTLEDTHDHVLTYTTVYLTDGENVYRTDTDEVGHYDFSYTPTSAGTMTLTVFYLGDEDHYEASEITVTLEVKAANTILTLDPIDSALINRTVTITGSLIDENGHPATGQIITLEITSEDGTYSLTNQVETDSDGIYTYTISFENAGTYIVTASFDGNDDYNPPSEEKETRQFEVTKIPTSISIEPVETTLIGDEVTITGTVTADNGGEITGTVTITYGDSKTQEYTLETDGEYTFIITDSSSAEGTYQFTITYSGDNWYLDSIAESEFDIDKIPTSIEIDNIGSYKYGDQVTINGKLTAENNADLTGKTVTIVITSADETDTLTIDDVAVQEGGLFEGITDNTLASTGSYTVTVTFTEDETYYGTSNSKEFTVDKKDITMEIEAESPITVGDTLTATITINDDDTIITDGILTVTVNGETEDVNITLDTDGIYTITYPTTQDGKYTIIARYTDPNGNYNDKEEITVVTAEKIETELSIDKITDDLTVGDTITITGKLTILDTETGIKDGSIIVLINGEQRAVFTGDNGEFSISDYVIPANDQLEIVAIYLGDNTYDVSYDEAHYDVNKKTGASITITPEESTVNVDDTVDLTITITGVDSTIKDLVVTINGETLDADLIKEGVTTGTYIVTVQPEKEGKYTIIATYTDSNGVYETVSDSAVVNAEKIKTTTKITKDDNEITITLTDNSENIYDQEVTITVIKDGYEYDPTIILLEDGTYSIPLSKFSPGLYTIEVIYQENDKYTSSHDIYSFTIDKIYTSISIDVQNSAKVGDIVTATLTIDGITDPDVTQFTVMVNGLVCDVFEKDGQPTIEFETDHDGTYTITAEYNGNTGEYQVLSATKTVLVSKVETTLNIDSAKYDEDENLATIIFDLTDLTGSITDATEFTVTINGVDTEIIPEYDLTLGKYTFTYTPETVGDYYVTVTYDGNSKYESSHASTSFKEEQKQANIEIKVQSTAKVGDKVTATIIIENIDQTNENDLVVTVNGKTTTATYISDNQYTITFEPEHDGEFIIIATYTDSNGVYETVSKTETVTAEKIESKVTINPIEDGHSAGDIIDITGKLTLTDETTGIESATVIVIINGVEQEVSLTGNDGTFTVANYEIPNTSQLDIVVEYDGDNKYTSSHNSTIYEITKKTTDKIEITTDKESYKVGDTVTATITLSDVGGTYPDTVTVTVNGKEETVTNNNDGTYTLSFTPETEGAYTIVATYVDENGVYQTVSYSLAVDVEKITTKVTIESINTDNKDQVVITGSLTGDDKPISGTVSIYINGEQVESDYPVNEGTFSYIYDKSEYGTNTVVVYFAENNTYTSSQDTKSYTITDTSAKTTSIVSVESISDITIGDTVTITGTLKDNTGNNIESGSVTVIINGESTTANVEDGVYTVSNYKPSSTGTYTVVVQYNGNDVYNPSTASTTFNVAKLTTNVTIDPIDDIKINESVIITGILKDKNGILANKEVTITINGDVLTETTNDKGEYYLNYTPKSTGAYYVLVDYPETANSTETHVATAFYTERLNTTITVYNATGYEGDTVDLVAHVVDERGNPVSEGKVAFKLNDVTLVDDNGNVIYVDVIDGVATLPYTITNHAANYTITGLYYGSDNYYTAKSEEYGILEVKKASMNTRVLVNDTTAQYGDTIELAALVLDEDGNIVTSGKVVFKLNGVSLKDKDGNVIYVTIGEDGYARYNYTITNNPKLYTVTAVYSGDGYYITSRNTTATLNVTNRVVDMTVDSVTGKSGDTIILTATIKEDNMTYTDNGVVVFKINGVTIRDDNGDSIKVKVVDGVAELPYEIPVDMAGKDYNITAVYSNKNYDRAEANNTLTVERSEVKTSITPLTTTKGSDTTITTVLYDENGNQLERSTKVAIKINGKTVVHTTTENGVLNVTIPTEELSKGDYNIEVVFGENSAYYEKRLNTTLSIV